MAVVNPFNKGAEEMGLQFAEGFRDPALKINDDRKIQISLNRLKQYAQDEKLKGLMMMLFVKEYENKDTSISLPEGEYDRAWFRLSNEETNQTLDYSLIKNIEQPEDY